jgi:DNA-binding transcriptional regulator PaaX
MNEKPLTKQILKYLAIGGGIVLVFSNPYGARSLIKGIRHEMKRRDIKDDHLKKRLYYLRDKKHISFLNKGNEIEIILTENGKKQVLKYDFDELALSKPKNWDGKWRLVMFDIPEYLHSARDALRQKLNDLGFVKFNHSVWIYPHECQKEIDFVSEVFEVGKYVHYITASSITNEDQLRLKFNLK